MKLYKNFFSRDAEVVAKELLGKMLIRKLNGKEMKAKIVETEAYYDEKDPASRACKNGDLRETMKKKGGTILIYGVHNNWMFNCVTGEDGKAEAVLLRALEPLNFSLRCSGPGLLTRALKIDKKLHKRNIFSNELYVYNNKENFEIGSSKRIGVKKDLNRNLRFFIMDNKFVSR
ncbi:MAG: DNA-3-methyladenine glycosylase [Nanoarchaeota archaeon]